MAIRIPRQGELIPAVLTAIEQAGGSATTTEINSSVGHILRLPDKAWKLRHGNGRGFELVYRLRWTRTMLKRAGVVTNPERGVWALSDGLDVRTLEPASLIRKQRTLPPSGGKTDAG